MERINFEKEICQFLGIPSIPKKKWDGKSSFKRACAIVSHLGKGQSYAVASFDAEVEKRPRIIKVFSLELFFEIKDIFVVPPYMDIDVSNMDLDEESHESAEALAEEAEDYVNAEAAPDEDSCESPYVFDNIHNDDEAKAYIRAYNKKKKIKGGLPRTHEGLIMRLNVINKELNQNKKNGK